MKINIYPFLDLIIRSLTKIEENEKHHPLSRSSSHQKKDQKTYFLRIIIIGFIFAAFVFGLDWIDFSFNTDPLAQSKVTVQSKSKSERSLPVDSQRKLNRQNASKSIKKDASLSSSPPSPPSQSVSKSLPPLSVQTHGLIGQSPTAIQKYINSLNWQLLSPLHLKHSTEDIHLYLKVKNGVIYRADIDFPANSLSMMTMEIWPLLVGQETGALDLPLPFESDQKGSQFKALYTLPSQRSLKLHVQYRTQGLPPYGPQSIRLQFQSKNQ